MNYITKCSQPQPPATVQQMAPVPPQQNPRHLEQVMRDMQALQSVPMSNVDQVTLVIKPDEYVQQRSQDILNQALGNVYLQ